MVTVGEAAGKEEDEEQEEEEEEKEEMDFGDECVVGVMERGPSSNHGGCVGVVEVGRLLDFVIQSGQKPS